ncbi:hypothetical protein DAEQUDRAFT_731575 [Daedalea quercina L-15889]|uniref:RING-type domain-containing protein n=1 Tax=Daedalea quercina L-15889 TaxID=1314783 RepID=A0A165M760_9APHY|nr:hypothetical protein DAEQUDRAFT_731575 [Daedalea quercina L-15889]
MSTGGMPLLSGPPPEYRDNELSCRKCDKEFNMLFARSRKCNHCGYLYCHSCTDFQALMPRGGSEMGYDPVPVCAFCIDNLTITAGGKSYLRSLPLAKLKKYANAYSIKVNGVLEKDDLVDALISARERTGCLPRTNEDHYRKYAVPNRRSNRPRGIFTRAMDAMGSDRDRLAQQNASPRQQRQQQQRPPPQYQPRQRTTSGPSTFPRPDLDPGRQSQARTHAYPQNPPPPPRGNAYHQSPPRPQVSSSHSHLNVPSGNSAGSPNSQPRGRTRATSASSPTTPRAHSPAPPVPTLDELLEMPEEDVAHLSIGTLKAVLFQNHVNARLVVEKAELVAKVRTLVEDERRERDRHAAIEAAERAAEEEAWQEREAEARRVAEEARLREEEAQREAARQDVRRDDESAMSVDVSGEQYPDMHMDAEAGPSSGAVPSVPPVSTKADAPPVPAKPDAPPVPPKSTRSLSPPARGLSPKAQAKAAQLERTGLCVICQDEEANIAIVDCGHLCLCRACSELIMKSSRECPLCRTRIVTEQRLLRIFKT